MGEEGEEAIERSCVFEERVRDAEKCKTQGNAHFAKGEFVDALSAYRRSLYHVTFDELSWSFELMAVHRETVNKVRVPTLTNAAACVIKMEQADEKALKEAVEFCDKALKALDEQDEEKPNSADIKMRAKALYRRGAILTKLDDHEKAVADFRRAAKLTPSDRAVRSALLQAQKMLTVQKASRDSFWRGALAGKILDKSEGTDEDKETPLEESGSSPFSLWSVS